MKKLNVLIAFVLLALGSAAFAGNDKGTEAEGGDADTLTTFGWDTFLGTAGNAEPPCSSLGEKENKDYCDVYEK